MTTRREGPTLKQLQAENEELRQRLAQAEDALRAIREGEVDAIIVSGSKGDRVFSLAETENLHRLMVEAMNEAGLATSPDGIILYCNPRVEALLQRPGEEILGRPLHEFVAPHNVARATALLREASVHPTTERVMFIARDGSPVPMQVWAGRADTLQGPMISLVATDLSILEADQALLAHLQEQQEALHARELELTSARDRLASDLGAMSGLQRVAALFVRGESLPIIIEEILDTAVVIAGAFSGDVQLRDASDAPYLAAHRGFEPWRLEFWEKHLDEAHSSCGACWEKAQRVIIEDVELDPVFADTPALDAHRRAGVRSVLSTPLLGRSGAVMGVLSLHFDAAGRPDTRTLDWLDFLAREATDVLERSETETALHRRQEELEALFSESPAAILIAHDPECHHVTRNAEAVRLFGHGDGARAIEQRLLQRCIVTGVSYRHGELEVVPEDGVPVTLTGGAAPLFDTSGAVRGAVAVFNNITLHRAVQEELRRAVVRGEQLVRELERTETELRKSHVDLEEMVKARTVLSEQRGEKLKVMANALSTAEQEERRRLAQILHDDLQQMLVAIRLRLASLESLVAETSLSAIVTGISEIVDGAITSSRSLTTELSPPVLREPMQQVMEWLGRWFETRHGVFVTVTTEPGVKEPPEEAKEFLFQAVRELLVNVRKHSGTDRAGVRIFLDGNHAAIEVRDEGKGVDPDLAASADHTAFGLQSIRERVELLGGSLDIVSAPGRGTSSTIRVPVTAVVVLPAEAGAANGLSPASDGSPPVRIVVVDDHTIFRRGLISILESYPGIKVVGEASDGEEGVEMVAALVPDVVIMDLAMPRMNGIEATRLIKSRFLSIDVIALSFQESEQVRSSFIDAGASAYFTKSGPIEELLQAIRRHRDGDAGAAAVSDAPSAASRTASSAAMDEKTGRARRRRA